MNTTELEAAIGKLTRDYATLQSRVLALEANAGLAGQSQHHTPAKAPKPDGAQIITLAPPLPELPNDEQYGELEQIVVKAYPQLAPDANRAEEFSRDFRVAFVHIAGLERADKPDNGRSVSWWLDHLRGECRRAVRGNAYVAAVLAQGDVGFIPAIPHEGQSWEFALKPYGGGRPATAAWRNVLKGELRSPTRSERQSDSSIGRRREIPSW